MAGKRTQIQLQRAPVGDDGFASVPGEFENFGPEVWAIKTDISDGERMVAAQIGAVITARFIVRRGAFASAVVETDRLIHGGRVFEIVAVKETNRSDRIEITAAALGR